MYRRGGSTNATLLFNLGVLLEDLERHTEAAAAYRQALDIDPRFADAHFNLARLHESAGEHQASLRHLVAYRRLL
jgi:tetratricopeptide (TPR) repeat protein